MKKNKIFLFGKIIVIFYISVTVILFCIGIGFLLWFPSDENWVITLIMSIPVIPLVIWMLALPGGGYIVKNNDQIEVYPLVGKKRRSYPLSDLYEVSVKKLLGYHITGEYICLYFSEKSKQETKYLENYSELWQTKEIIPIAYAKKYMMQLREMLGEEVWKEKYKGT